MHWTDLPYILRLLVGIGVGFLILYLGGALVGFLVTKSVCDKPPAVKGEMYKQYMELAALRKLLLAVFYIGLLLELAFIPLVVKHVSNASIGHLILFGSFTAIGMIGNIAAFIKQRRLL